MVLGYLMIGLGLGIATPTACDMGKTIFEFAKNKRNYRKELPINETDQEYNKLFQNLEIIDPKKGDWVKCLEVTPFKNYLLVKFKLSDTLSVNDFIKHQAKLEEKMLTEYNDENYKNKIQIYSTNGYMYFRILKEHIDLIPYEFKKTAKHLIPLGTDLDDNIVYWNLKKDPHLKIIGTTGSGKSRQQNIIINHILNNIKDAPLWLMDFKGGIEFGIYENVKNVVAYADSLDNAPYVLQSLKDEYERRIAIIKEAGFRSFDDYIENKPNASLKRGFCVSDEFADLMDLNNKKEGYDAIKEIVDLSRKLRAAGLHIVLGTQRPTADNMPSSMKNNVTGTIAMKMENEFNSRLVIDDIGCELLEQSLAIAKLESKRTFFRSFYIEDKVINDTVEKFKKEDKEPTKLPKDDKKIKVLK